MNLKKALVGIFILMLILSGCGKGYWVMKKAKLDEETGVRAYVNYLQNEKPDRRGFKVIDISEGLKMVVVSTGTTKRELEAVSVEYLENQTVVTVKEFDAESDELNPYILIGLKKPVSKFKVVNEDGEEYEIGF
ncbi:hypothetical protein QTL97_08940 [Sporosarcina thermotolerans]|uniref:DUF3221 domain-containing protein n=1 Tax=Sporosarcina thermotolerans TaxID=633404 RepID=A0AAW9A7R1_9BACL|nr:hypothetical protein [Sporosarcina thermotolerans]MDW0117059.1 hypothetical protein [Sporosarcina thermotolerans]WHT47838.1 hypothetical protein QNH10_17370 [Sporosarcina thermotolerans]